MGIGYSYADWLIKKRILSVVKLYKPQQKQLEKQLDDYMAWHKVTMLPEYGKELDRVAKRVEALKKDKKKVSKEEVYRLLLKTRQLYLDSFLPLTTRVVPILSELIEGQVDRSRTLMTRKVDEIKEQTKLTQEQVASELRGTWEDNLDDWFGKLSEEQLKLLDEHIPLLVTSPMIRFARGVKRMQIFLAVFESNPIEKNLSEYKEKRIKGLTDFFKTWSELKPYEPWRQQTALFMSKFLELTTTKQLDEFLKKLKKWQDAIDEIQK
jgi:hypothetical protein